MNSEEKNGWKMVWIGVGLMVASCLLIWVTLSAESFGLHGVPYCVVIGILCAAYVVAMYIVVRRFFSKKK